MQQNISSSDERTQKFSGQGLIPDTVTVRRPTPVNADTRWTDRCHYRWGAQVDRHSALQDMPTWSGTDMAAQGYARTVIAVYSSAIQQIVGYRLLSLCIQECGGSSAAKEGGARWQ